MKKIISTIILILIKTLSYSQIAPDPGSEYINFCNPSGKPLSLSVVKYSLDLTAIKIRDLENEMRSNYPHCIIIAPATQKYNCHGYAFSVADGNDTVKIGYGIKDTTFYSDTDSYWEISNYVYPAKIIYADRWTGEGVNHSAITTNHPDTLIAKNGNSPLIKYYKQSNTPGAGWIGNGEYKFRYFVKRSDFIIGPETMTCNASFTLNPNIQGEIRWQAEPANLFTNASGTGRIASLSFKQNLSPQMAQAKITFFYKRSGCDNTNSVALPFAAAVPSPRLDLYIKDTPDDLGTEPNPVSQCLYISEDIWIRNEPNEGFTIHTTENPEYDANNPVFVFVRVRNKSILPSTGNEKLHLYWAKAGLDLVWPDVWTGNYPYPVAMGGEIGSQTMPVIESCGDLIFQFPWRIPNPANYESLADINEPFHFCLLARIEADNDPMTYPEIGTLWMNVGNNNNIAWKNVTVVDNAIDSPNPGGKVWLANNFKEKKIFRLNFADSEKNQARSILEEAEVSIKLSEKLYEAWKNGGFMEKGIKDMGEHRLLITEPESYIENLELTPEEIHTLYAEFHFLTQEVTDKPTFKYFIDLQYLNDEQKYETLGGEQYIINKWKRDLFKADAGNDKLVSKNEDMQLQASPISESATYNWYDMNDSLLYSGQNFTVSTNQTQKYKLEVIAEKDGYKDYDEVTVKVKEFAIKCLSPNPTHTDLTVEYDAENATSAILCIYNNNGILLRTIQLNPQMISINFSVANYQQGSYSVVLVCNGQIMDSKTFIVN